MKIALWTFAFAVGFAAVFISCIVWLGLWGKVSPGGLFLMWAIWCGPWLCMMAESHQDYQRTLKRLRADSPVLIEKILSC